MKVLGYVMLHYGADYLEYALRPLCEVCDDVIILYQMYPSHHGQQHMRCPEKRKDLIGKTHKYDNTHWIDVYCKRSEGEHLGEIWKHTRGYDVLVRADYDEIWDAEDLKKGIHEAYCSPYRNHGIDGFVHFWRSFNYELQPDYFRPVRLHNLREKNISKEPVIKAKIYHFGYAIRRRNMEYKLTIHGHRAEMKDNWLHLWNNWSPQHKEGLFHPASNDIWTHIVDFDRSNLPEFMREHPFYDKAII